MSLVAATQQQRAVLEDEEELPEIHDTDAVLAEKCSVLCELMEDAKRVSWLLGAGISASQLPTFRGRNGLWTSTADQNDLANANVSDAKPTLAHRALVALRKKREGLAYHVATMNIDDLSFSSGFPDDSSTLSEMHGNLFKEKCTKCGRVYRRDFLVSQYDNSPTPTQKRETGRLCENQKCRTEPLVDSIVYFGEALPRTAKNIAFTKFRSSCLRVVLGSSLRVEPVNEYPFLNDQKKTKKSCIVGLQATPKDDEATLVIRGTCDEVMNAVAKHFLGGDWDAEH